MASWHRQDWIDFGKKYAWQLVSGALLLALLTCYALH